jgi:hypothetical protein
MSVASLIWAEASKDLLKMVAVVPIKGVLEHSPPSSVPKAMVWENALQFEPPMLQRFPTDTVVLIHHSVHLLQPHVSEEVAQKEGGGFRSIPSLPYLRAKNCGNRAVAIGTGVVIAKHHPKSIAPATLFDDKPQHAILLVIF